MTAPAVPAVVRQIDPEFLDLMPVRARIDRPGGTDQYGNPAWETIVDAWPCRIDQARQSVGTTDRTGTVLWSRRTVTSLIGPAVTPPPRSGDRFVLATGTGPAVFQADLADAVETVWDDTAPHHHVIAVTTTKEPDA